MLTSTADFRRRQGNAERMLLVLAHELRGPLTPIRYAAASLSMQHAACGATSRAVAVIERQLKAIEALIASVLEAARLELDGLPMAPARLNLGEALTEVLEQLAPLVAERGHALVFEPPLQPIHVTADPARLRQVLHNLLTNAVKFTGRGGRVEAQLAACKGIASIRILDNGRGLAPDMLDTIFELYAQGTQAGEAHTHAGLGIGLYVARQIVSAHGGTLVASSAGANAGSEFTVRLPLDEAPRASAARARPGTAAAGA